MLDSPAVASRDDLEAPNGIERMIERALPSRRASHAMLSMSLAAPLSCAERLLLLQGSRTSLLWATADDEEYAGVGAARTLSGSGESRFDTIREGAARLFRDLEVIALDGLPAPPPRLVGGFAFNPAQPRDTIWQGFGAALFVMPRVAYMRRADQAWLTLTASAPEFASAAGRRRLALEARQALEALSSGIGPAISEPAARSFPRGADCIEESVANWSTLVAGIAAEIAAGRLEKAVAARRVTIRSACLPHAACVLERLRLEAPACTRFALRVGTRTFLGASPESLVRRAGSTVVTEAVAGSMRRAARNAGETLLRSGKDCAEHAIVVREIQAALAPLCKSVSSEAPVPLRLRHLLHLRTRIVGILDKPRHVLDLVALLHPTPAVGGTPRAAALQWLDDHEYADRGFYGGPFGVFDGAGDGHFIVAIRSGLLDADAAHLFAGAGIVTGSQSRNEWTETRWKLRSLMAAIGVR